MAASLDCSNVRNRNINHVTHHHQHQHAHHRRPMVTRDSSYEYNVSSHAKSSQCKMKSSTLSTSKTIVVISIVIGCFAILWPRMFYPMLQAAFRSQSTTKKVPYMDRTGTRGWFILFFPLLDLSFLLFFSYFPFPLSFSPLSSLLHGHLHSVEPVADAFFKL